MGKAKFYYGLLVRLVVSCALFFGVLMFYFRYSSLSVRISDADHSLDRLRDELRGLSSGIQNFGRVAADVKTVPDLKTGTCTLERKYIITRITDLARKFGAQSFEIVEATDVTGSFGFLREKIDAASKVKLIAYEVLVDFGVILEDDVHNILKAVERDVGQIFLSSLHMELAKKVDLQMLRDINSSKGPQLIRGSVKLYWFDLCSPSRSH